MRAILSGLKLYFYPVRSALVLSSKLYGLFFVFQIEFNLQSVYVPDVPGIFTSFVIDAKRKKTPLFVDPRLFSEPMHYALIMGYDKDIDFDVNKPLKRFEKEMGLEEENPDNSKKN